MLRRNERQLHLDPGAGSPRPEREARLATTKNPRPMLKTLRPYLVIAAVGLVSLFIYRQIQARVTFLPVL